MLRDKSCVSFQFAFFFQFAVPNLRLSRDFARQHDFFPEAGTRLFCTILRKPLNIKWFFNI